MSGGKQYLNDTATRVIQKVKRQLPYEASASDVVLHLYQRSERLKEEEEAEA